MLILSLSTKAQDIIIKNLGEKITTNFQNSKSEKFRIQNYSNLDKSIKIKTNVNNLQGGATLQICYDNNCQESSLALVITIPANSLSNEISIILNGGLSNYKETAYFEFIDMDVDKGIKKKLS